MNFTTSHLISNLNFIHSCSHIFLTITPNLMYDIFLKSYRVILLLSKLKSWHQSHLDSLNWNFTSATTYKHPFWKLKKEIRGSVLIPWVGLRQVGYPSHQQISHHLPCFKFVYQFCPLLEKRLKIQVEYYTTSFSYFLIFLFYTIEIQLLFFERLTLSL